LAEFVLPYSIICLPEKITVFSFYGLKIPTKIGLFQVPKLIMEALEWLGIPPDETIGKNEKFGPYRQSERKPLYKDYADQLINTGWAYYAFDSAEALDAARKEQEARQNLYLQSHQQRNIRYFSGNFY
jgi:glutamyl/glutaminyl-tRNA synthetase